MIRRRGLMPPHRAGGGHAAANETRPGTPAMSRRGALPSSSLYSRCERGADAAIHGLGVAFAATGAAALAWATQAAMSADVAAGGLRLAAALVYGATLVATLSLSAAYNLATGPDWPERLRRWDHAAIFLLIAGTYTPFGLVALGGLGGGALTALVWTAALAGMVLKLRHPRGHEGRFVALYLALGWIGLPAAGALVAALSPAALALLAGGGLLYTAGVAFHLWHRLPYQNAIWHAFVLAGAICHYAAVRDVLVPPG